MKRLVYVLVLMLFIFSSCGQSKTDLPMSTTCEVGTTGGFQFAFHYDKEEPAFEFVSPSGIVYKEGSESLTVERQTQPGGFDSIYFIFAKGEIGEWKINYDKFTNESVDFYYAVE